MLIEFRLAKIIIIEKSRDVREVSYQKIMGKQIIDLLLIASFFFSLFRSLWGPWTKRWRVRLPWKRCIEGELWFTVLPRCYFVLVYLYIVLSYCFSGCVGRWECQQDHRPGLDWQGWLNLVPHESLSFCCFFNMVALILTAVLFIVLDRTQLSRLLLIISLFKNSMELLMSGVGASKRYYSWLLFVTTL